MMVLPLQASPCKFEHGYMLLMDANGHILMTGKPEDVEEIARRVNEYDELKKENINGIKSK